MKIWKMMGVSMLCTLYSMAETYSNTSYYVAYDDEDSTQYVLIMPAVQKIYVHKAGDILNLLQVDDYFATFPKYEEGEICFSEETENTIEENVKEKVEKMAQRCYTVNFFYTQKELTENGMAFMLFYAPGDKVYEGLAGNAESFKVVKDGENIYNENSLTQDDYTYFEFSISDAIIDGMGGEKPESLSRPPEIPTI